MRKSSLQSHARFPLTGLLANGGSVRILRALVTHGGPLSVGQLARDAGLTPQGTRLVLNALTTQGAVTMLGKSRSQVFSLNQDYQFNSDLQALFDRERAQWEELWEEMRAVVGSIKNVRSAWLYGSVARGDDRPSSDIDVAAVISKGFTQAADELRDSFSEVGARLLVHFSVVALAPQDVVAQSASGPWWKSLVDEARLLKGHLPQEEMRRCKLGASGK